MSSLSLVLFVHVTSAIAVFVALALEGVILQQLRSAEEREPLLRAVRTFARLRVIYIPAFLGILIGGGYLASRYGRATGWIPLSVAATLGLMIIGGVVTGRRVERLRRAISIVGDAPGFGAIRDQTTSVALIRVYGFRVGLTLGIVFLMTVQPEFVPSVIALVSAAAIGPPEVRRVQPPDVRTA